MGQWPVSQFLATGFARAGLVHAGLALFSAFLTIGILRRPDSLLGWIIVTTAAFFLIVSGAWLVHGVSRLENAAPLMAVTVLHQFGAALWVGGVINLTYLWHSMRLMPSFEDL